MPFILRSSPHDDKVVVVPESTQTAYVVTISHSSLWPLWFFSCKKERLSCRRAVDFSPIISGSKTGVDLLLMEQAQRTLVSQLQRQD